MEVLIGLALLGCAYLLLKKRLGPQNTVTEDAAAGHREAREALELTVRYTFNDDDEFALQPPKGRDVAGAAENAWVSPGEARSVAGIEFPDGMLYIGADLPAVVPYVGVEPSLIDPRLPLEAPPDWSADSLHYWPSYDSIPPASRSAYLTWLATGRRDPEAPIGFVFLFFYGLERRLLFDAQYVDRVKTEAPHLVAEIEALLAIYGKDYSFQSYARQLLAIVRLKMLRQACYSDPPPTTSPSYEMPLGVLIPLAQLVSTGKPIPSDWALAWCLSHEATWVRTPARRCWEELQSLFAIRYRHAYGDGLSLKANKKRLVRRIQLANRGLGGDFLFEARELPDVGSLSRPVRAIREVVERCTADLDAYSRLLGRDSEARGTVRAFALLPPEIAAMHEGEEVAKLREWVHDVLEQDGVAPASEILSRWPVRTSTRMSKREAVEFTLFLDKLDVGVEPDVRFGGATLTEKTKVVLFSLPEDHPTAPSKEYLAAMLLLHLATMVATADGTVCLGTKPWVGQHQECLVVDALSGLRPRNLWSLSTPGNRVRSVRWRSGVPRLYLGLQRFEKKWSRSIRRWSGTLGQRSTPRFSDSPANYPVAEDIDSALRSMCSDWPEESRSGKLARVRSAPRLHSTQDERT